MPEPDKEGERKRDQFQEFLQKNLTKGELALKHAIGLGQVPNAVPLADPVLDGPPRPVEVGWHPVGGLAGKWFAEETGLGKMITDRINKYPDPTQHWAVLVGEFAHQLWMDENFHVIYTNAKIRREEWRTFHVGETRFNDDATRRAGESVIQGIRERQPVYNLITNNCQTYALQLLDAIKAKGQTEFGTTLAVYERLVGPGKVMDLWSKPEVQDGGEAPQAAQTSVSLAQQVMDENTTQLNPQEEQNKQDQQKGKKTKFFSRFLPEADGQGGEAPQAGQDENNTQLDPQKEQGKEDRQKEKKNKFFSRFLPEANDQGGEAPRAGQDSVSRAQQVTDENAAQLDPQEEQDKEDQQKEKKSKFFSRFLRS